MKAGTKWMIEIDAQLLPYVVYHHWFFSIFLSVWPMIFKTSGFYFIVDIFSFPNRLSWHIFHFLQWFGVCSLRKDLQTLSLNLQGTFLLWILPTVFSIRFDAFSEVKLDFVGSFITFKPLTFQSFSSLWCLLHVGVI